MAISLQSLDAELRARSEHYTTIEVARMLGLAVRSVQLMVDRGELTAWKTPGGHRRISPESVERWRAKRHEVPEGAAAAGSAQPVTMPARSAPEPRTQRAAPSVLLIEDSAHYQNLVALLMRQLFPDTQLHIADDGIAGLALCGRLQPDVLIVDLLLPGIDGATLITSLRSSVQFACSQLIVVTSLNEEDRAPFAFALGGVPVVHKSQLALELPTLLARSLSHTRCGSGIDVHRA